MALDTRAAASTIPDWMPSRLEPDEATLLRRALRSRVSRKWARPANLRLAGSVAVLLALGMTAAHATPVPAFGAHVLEPFAAVAVFLLVTAQAVHRPALEGQIHTFVASIGAIGCHGLIFLDGGTCVALFGMFTCLTGLMALYHQRTPLGMDFDGDGTSDTKPDVDRPDDPPLRPKLRSIINANLVGVFGVLFGAFGVLFGVSVYVERALEILNAL